ncbi:MAG: hypothetical protein FVQ77_04855 [Cytophagales bacterium]|nr:hypothetical protein [Cytophagales bacterium]
MITKTKTEVKIPLKEWNALQVNPFFAEMFELLEDISDLEKAKTEKGKDVTLTQYLKNRGIQHNH